MPAFTVIALACVFAVDINNVPVHPPVQDVLWFRTMPVSLFAERMNVLLLALNVNVAPAAMSMTVPPVMVKALWDALMVELAVTVMGLPKPNNPQPDVLSLVVPLEIVPPARVSLPNP